MIAELMLVFLAIVLIMMVVIFSFACIAAIVVSYIAETSGFIIVKTGD